MINTSGKAKNMNLVKSDSLCYLVFLSSKEGSLKMHQEDVALFMLVITL